jgi:hypothetical protein
MAPFLNQMSICRNTSPSTTEPHLQHLPALYFEGSGFKPRPGDQISWLILLGGVPQALQQIPKIMPQNMPPPVSFAVFAIHYFLLILSFDGESLFSVAYSTPLTAARI